MQFGGTTKVRFVKKFLHGVRLPLNVQSGVGHASVMRRLWRNTPNNFLDTSRNWQNRFTFSQIFSCFLIWHLILFIFWMSFLVNYWFSELIWIIITYCLASFSQFSFLVWFVEYYQLFSEWSIRVFLFRFVVRLLFFVEISMSNSEF